MRPSLLLRELFFCRGFAVGFLCAGISHPSIAMPNDQPPKTDPPASAPRKLSLARRLLFAALLLVGFFVALELILLAAGVDPVLYSHDPYVGFSNYVPLFTETEAEDGSVEMVTHPSKVVLFNEQRFPKVKDDNVRRVFCMGGSTTAGRPYDDVTSFCGWLRLFTNEADADQEWEFINCGAMSYASFRVAKIMEELVAYEPDLFIIYTGNNEFQEDRTYGELRDMSPLAREAHTLLTRTRTYALLDKLAIAAGRDDLPPPENILDDKIFTRLDLSVGPERYTRDDIHREKVINHCKFNLHRMIDIANSVGAKVILVAPGVKLRECAPFKSEHREGVSESDALEFAKLYEQASVEFKTGNTDAALATTNKALAIDDRYAHLHFLRGQVYEQLTQYEKAKQAYLRALDEDVCSLRALKATTQTVRDVAAERDVPLVDFAALVEGYAAQNIPGEAEFLDHVHPTIEGHRRISLSLLDTMEADDVFTRPASLDDAAIENLTAQHLEKINVFYHATAQRQLSLLLAWAGKREEAHRAALKAIELLPDYGRGHANLADSYRHREEWELSEKHYRRALWLEPESLHAANGLAWFHVTCPVEKYRNAHEAVKLAAYCAEMTDHEHPEFLHTLAAAEALAGNYEEAARLEEKVQAAAPTPQKPYLQLNIDGYRAGKPFHEHPTKL